jgi:GntR family transcriptional repressor for pyruvate dehydrogenase complex
MERTSLIESIVSEIKDRVISGELKEGDSLGSQDDLARSMGVSRASLREALNRLNLMGLVETRQGSGTFIRRTMPVDYMSSLSSLLIMDQVSAAELLDARLHIESAVAALAAKNATELDIKKIKFVLNGMENDFRANKLGSFIARDVQFHMLIAESSKNRVLVKVVEIIRDILRQFIKKFFDALPMSVSDAVAYHRKIYEAIERHDPVAARKHMEDHIMSLIDRSRETPVW